MMTEICDFLEKHGACYAARLPANRAQRERAAHLSTQPVDWPPNDVRRYFATFERTLALRDAVE